MGVAVVRMIFDRLIEELILRHISDFSQSTTL